MSIIYQSYSILNVLFKIVFPLSFLIWRKVQLEHFGIYDLQLSETGVSLLRPLTTTVLVYYSDCYSHSFLHFSRKNLEIVLFSSLPFLVPFCHVLWDRGSNRHFSLPLILILLNGKV